MKKGFTLIEMLAVLVIISVLSVISVVSVINIQSNSKNKLYNEQIKRIESSAKLWAVENSGTLYDKNLYYLSLKEMADGDFLEDTEIANPKDNTKMNGCVVITYENDKYSYEYDEYCRQTTYEITYNLVGGYENTNIKIYTKETETFTLNNPTRFGYTFKGWSGTEIDGMSSEVTIVKGSEGNRTYTANWQRNEYSITYILNGGDFVTSNPTSYYEDGVTITINPPVKVGYVFTGWSGTGINGVAKYLSIVRGSTGDRTYTANWELAQYTIAYKLNDGTALGNPTSYNMLSETFTINNPTKTYYKFLGWTGTDISNMTSSLTIEKGSVGNKEYTANWEINSFTLTVNPNGGVWNGTISQMVDVGSTINIENPTNGKYLFDGWDISESTSHISETTFTMGSANTTLIAKWRALNESDYSYTGNSVLIDDGEGNWRIKFLTSGTFTIKSGLNIDAFLVGGGGSGKCCDGFGGGGGGYTLTKKNISITKEKEYNIVVGLGGVLSGWDTKTGQASSAFEVEAAGGRAGEYGGGNGGSGGGPGRSGQGCGGGASNGGGGGGGYLAVGIGQGKTTCEFGESGCSSDKLYAGGGGGCGSVYDGVCCNDPVSCGGGAGGGGTCGSNGATNRGGGGGGNASGGSGIVIIRNAR